MNLLLIKTTPNDDQLAESLRSARRSVRVTELCFPPFPLNQFEYLMKTTPWFATGAGPNAMLFLLDDVQQAAQLTIVAKIANRDGCLLIVLVRSGLDDPGLPGMEQKILQLHSETFVLYQAPVLTQPKAVAAVLVSLTEFGYFGRYRVITPNPDQPNEIRVAAYPYRIRNPRPAA